MQSTTARFDELMTKPIKKVAYDLGISFSKEIEPDTEYFMLNVSVLNGFDLLAPTGDNPLTEWWKYLFLKYTNRVIRIEWSNEMSLLTSVSTAMADIELNNYDDLFTRNSGSPLNGDLLPRRPVKILTGFDTELLPQFVGLSENAPEINRDSKTASIHANDFMNYIFSRKMDNTSMFINKRIDEILRSLFNAVGVLDSQMDLDEARTTVPFAYFEKDLTYRTAIERLMTAEMGTLFMREDGVIVFKDRLHSSTYTDVVFDHANVIDYEGSTENTIINSVRVRAEVRQLQPRDVVFSLSEKILINAGQTVSKFFEFQNPVIDDEPISFYEAFNNEDGTGTNRYNDVEIVDQTNFGTDILVEIKNNGGTPLYVTALSIYGKPAPIVRTVDVIEKDQDSIDMFEEQILEIESPYIQTESLFNFIKVFNNC